MSFKRLDKLMTTKHWPFGTRKQVEVIQVIEVPPKMIVACREPATNEGFICLYKINQVQAVEGQSGVLTFRAGGPTGGYWDYQANAD